MKGTVLAVLVALAVRVPFDFRAGDVHLPPGEYVLAVEDPGGSLTIRGTDHGRGAILPVRATGAAGRETPTVSFRAYGDSRFLSAIQAQDGPRWEIAPSADEDALTHAIGQPKAVSLKAATFKKP